MRYAEAKDFARMAVEVDVYAMAAAHVASVEAHSSQVRRFAQDMTAEHTRSAHNIVEAARAAVGGEPPPYAMSGEHARLLMALQSISGPDFDRTYMHQHELVHHQVLETTQAFARSGGEPGLRRIAQAAAPRVARHLETVRRLMAGMRL